MTEALEKVPMLVIGKRNALVNGANVMIDAAHIHQCGHACNSPYCENPPELLCETCGGPPRIQPGYEPWRGR